MATELSVFNLDTKKIEQGKKFFDKKNAHMEKMSITCEFCKKKSHGKDTCFKLHGVLDWYKEIPRKKTSFSTNFASKTVVGSTSEDRSKAPLDFDLEGFYQE